MTSDDVEVIEDIFVYLVGVAGGVVSVLGILGNAMSLYILVKPEIRASNCSLYLIALSVYDLFFLVLNFMVTSLDWIVYGADPLSLFTLKFTMPAAVVVDPVIAFAISASASITVALTADRCVAVFKPLQWADICTRGRVKVIIVLTFMWSLLTTGPMFAEMQHENVFVPGLNESYLRGRETTYGKSWFHTEVYLKYLVPAFTLVIPISAIFICNSLLLLRLSCQRRHASKMSSTPRRPSQDTGRLTAQVLFISFLTLASRALQAASYISTTLEGTKYVTLCTLGCAATAAASAFLLVVNSAVNFLCYCYFGQRFRSLFLATFCFCRRAKSRRPQTPRHVGHGHGHGPRTLSLVEVQAPPSSSSPVTSRSMSDGTVQDTVLSDSQEAIRFEKRAPF